MRCKHGHYPAGEERTWRWHDHTQWSSRSWHPGIRTSWHTTSAFLLDRTYLSISYLFFNWLTFKMSSRFYLLMHVTNGLLWYALASEARPPKMKLFLSANSQRAAVCSTAVIIRWPMRGSHDQWEGHMFNERAICSMRGSYDQWESHMTNERVSWPNERVRWPMRGPDELWSWVITLGKLIISGVKFSPCLSLCPEPWILIL